MYALARNTNTTGQVCLIILLKLSVIFHLTLDHYYNLISFLFCSSTYINATLIVSLQTEAPTETVRAIKHILVLDMSLGQHESSTKQSNEIHLVRDELNDFLSLPYSPASDSFHQAVQVKSSNEVVDEEASRDENPSNSLDVGGTYHGSIEQRPSESQQIVSPMISGWQLKIVIFSYVSPPPKALS